MLPLYDGWPKWLQYLVVVPHGLLGWAATWLWWPKSKQGWNRFGLVAAYLLVFGLVMHFVFHAW
jgi:hypothetical protein